MFEVNEGIRGPEFSVKLLARNQLTGVFQQTDQDLDWLPFQPDFAALLLELARAQIKLEDPKSDETRGWYRRFHCT